MQKLTPTRSLVAPRQTRDVRIEETPLETCQCYPVGERNTQVPPDQRLATRSAAEPKGDRREAVSEAEVRREHRPRH
jgi:hypothetical protein